MPGAHWSRDVRRRAQREFTLYGDAKVVQTRLQIAFGVTVPTCTIERWSREEEVLGYPESKRQHNKRVREEHAELTRSAVVRQRVPQEVRTVVYDVVRRNPFAYARELVDEVHSETGLVFSEGAINRIRRELDFSRSRAGRPLGEADPIEQRMYKNMLEQMQIRDEQLVFIDETRCATPSISSQQPSLTQTRACAARTTRSSIVSTGTGGRARRSSTARASIWARTAPGRRSACSRSTA